MKDIHLSAYGNPAQSLSMLEVSEPYAISANEALVRMEYAPIEVQRPPFSERRALSETEASFCHWR